MSVVAVDCEADYLTALGEIDRLAESESEEIGVLQELIRLVVTYELRRFPPEPAQAVSTCPWHRKAA